MFLPRYRLAYRVADWHGNALGFFPCRAGFQFEKSPYPRCPIMPAIDGSLHAFTAPHHLPACLCTEHTQSSSNQGSAPGPPLQPAVFQAASGKQAQHQVRSVAVNTGELLHTMHHQQAGKSSSHRPQHNNPERQLPPPHLLACCLGLGCSQHTKNRAWHAVCFGVGALARNLPWRLWPFQTPGAALSPSYHPHRSSTPSITISGTLAPPDRAAVPTLLLPAGQ